MDFGLISLEILLFTIDLLAFTCKPRFKFAELKSLSSNGIRSLEVLRKHLSYSSFAFLTLREFFLKHAYAVLVMLLLFAHAILVVPLSFVQAFCEFALGGVRGCELLDQDIFFSAACVSTGMDVTEFECYFFGLMTTR